MVQWFLKKFSRVEFCFDDSRFTGNVKAGKEELLWGMVWALD